MKSSVRQLVYFGHVVVVSAGLAALANCGGGERPPPAADDPSDASPNNTNGEGGSNVISLTGFDPAAGVVFGDNGLVNCGAQAPDKIITLKNPKPDIVNFKATLTAGKELFKLNPEEGGVPARGQATIQIIASPIPQESDTVTDLYAGTLEITTSDGEPPMVLRLHQTARGAVISTTIKGDLVDFGDVKIGTLGTQPLSITNAGNVEVTANLAVGTSFFKVDGAQTAAIKLGAGETAAKSVTLGTVTQVDYTDTLALTFNSSAVHCKTPPGSATLKGKGSTSVGVSPGTLPFGQVNCGAQAPFQTIKITSTAAMNFTPTLGLLGNSPYALADNAGAPITAGNPIDMGVNDTYTLRVVPKTISKPASTANGAFDDVLTITTNVGGDTPHKVDLKETAKGAVFALAPASIPVMDSVLSHNTVKDFNIVNSGNLAAPYIVSVVKRADQNPDPPANTFLISLDKGTAQPGNTAGTLTLRSAATKGVQYTGDIFITADTGAVMCADLPPGMPVLVETPL